MRPTATKVNNHPDLAKKIYSGNIDCALSIQKQIFPIPRKYTRVKPSNRVVLDIQFRKLKPKKEIITQTESGLKLNKIYSYKLTELNPDYTPDKIIPLRSCHITINDAKKEKQYHYTKTPKRFVNLEVANKVNTETGEVDTLPYQTNDIKQIKNRKIQTIKRFCDFYEPLYQKRQISLLFHTFSRANYSSTDMRRMANNVKKRYAKINREILGYLWAIEFAENINMDGGLHVHYHLIVAIRRINVTVIPEALKFNDLWGQRTGVEFIKKSVRNYLSKYLYKGDGKILGRRNYSTSRTLKTI